MVTYILIERLLKINRPCRDTRSLYLILISYNGTFIIYQHYIIYYSHKMRLFSFLPYIELLLLSIFHKNGPYSLVLFINGKHSFFLSPLYMLMHI